MHELSIVMGIVDIAKKEVTKAKKSKVDSIELEIGTLSGIEMESLDFAWNMAVEGTVLEGAERNINRIVAIAKCTNCGHEFETKSAFEGCPACGELFTELLCGRELRVKALTVT
jgi:hydrogenase nickel incorporation protein HypA/HybF